MADSFGGYGGTSRHYYISGDWTCVEAFILESELIKNTFLDTTPKRKIIKSFNYVVITKEDFPRVLSAWSKSGKSPALQKQEQIESLGFEYTDVFGPFPFGAELVRR